MYKTLDKHKMFKPLLIIAIIFATIAGGLLWQGKTSVQMPGLRSSVVYADDGDSDSESGSGDSGNSGAASGIFDDVMSDSKLDNWSDFTKKNKLPNNTGTYWSKINGLNNWFFGVTTGTSHSFSYNNPHNENLTPAAQATSKGALFMKALSDTGLDHSTAGGNTSNPMTFVGRWVGGLLIFAPLLVISGVNFGFGALLNVADYLNVFKYIANKNVPDGVMGNVVKAINSVYTLFTDAGMIVAGLVLAVTIFAYAIGMHQLNDGRRLGSLLLRYLLRIFVVVAGPLVIAISFSAMLDDLKGAYDTPTVYDNTIMSNMVDFENWSYHSRLGIPQELNGTLSTSTGVDSKDVSATQIRAINSAGAGHTIGGNGNKGGNTSGVAFDMVSRWMSNKKIDAGQYASHFQVVASAPYFKGYKAPKPGDKKTDADNQSRKELNSVGNDWINHLLTSGSIDGSGKWYTSNGDAPKSGAHKSSFRDANGYGLSTVGMYNYLSSYDDGGGMQWVRLSSLANDVSKPEHYSVGFAGHGVKFFANYLSVLVSLSAIATLALIFAWRAIAAVFKGFFGTMVRAFTSGMSGSPVELSKLLAEFLSMLVQLYGGAFLYQITSKMIGIFNTPGSGIFSGKAGAVGGTMTASGFGTMAEQVVTSVITIFIVIGLIKYAGKFNKAIDDFLTQGIDRIMGKGGYASGAAKRNEGGLTDGAGNAGTGGGMNNDGISSNGNMLTNPDGWLGRRANRKAKKNEVMNNAADQTPQGRKKALRAYQAKKGLAQAVRGAGFEGAGNDLENMADLAQRQAKNRRGVEDDEEDKDAQKNQEGQNPSFGDGSQNKNVADQELSDDEKQNGDEPVLEYDDDGNPTDDSIAKQQAYANHAVGDTKPDSEDTPDKGIAGESEDDKNLRRGVMDASQANKALEDAKRDLKNATSPQEKADAEKRIKEASDDLVQNAESDVRTAQNDLANAKTPEERKDASDRLNNALTAYRAAQNEAQQAIADSQSTLEPDKTRGEVAGDVQRSMNKLAEVDGLRDQALDVQGDGSREMQGVRDAMQKDFADKDSSTHNSVLARKSADATKLSSNVESAYKKSPNAKAYSKPDDAIRQAKIDTQVARNAAVKKGVKGNPTKAKAYKNASNAVVAARKQYVKSGGSASAMAAYKKASTKLTKIEDSAIKSLGTHDSAYKALQTAERVEDKTVSDASLRGRIDNRPEIIASADTAAQAIMQGAVGQTSSKIAHQVQSSRQHINKGKTEFKQANQVLETAKTSAKTKVGASVLAGNRELGSKVITKYGNDMAKAKGGTQTAKPMFDAMSKMTPKQAVEHVKSLPAKQQRTMQRAILRGEQSAPQVVQQAITREVTTSAIKQQYDNFRTSPARGNKPISLARMNSAAKQFAELEEKRVQIANNKNNLNPAEQNRQAQAISKAQIQLSKKLGNATAAKKLMTAKYRNKVRQDYANVVDNSKMGMNYNVSGKLKQPKLVQAVSEGISKDAKGHITHVARQHARRSAPESRRRRELI